MRINSFRIQNFKGIKEATATDLATQGLIVLSGKNGTGKTLVLEALLLNWTGRTSLVDFIGPWGDEVRLETSVSFSDEELDILESWHVKLSDSPVSRQEFYTVAHSSNKLRNDFTKDEEDPLLVIARSANFQRENQFSVIDYLPAARNVNVSNSNSVDLTMFDVERVEFERRSQTDSVSHRGGLHLPDVSSYLLTLHYQQFLAAQQDLDIEDEYTRISTVFSRATGKTISQPQYDTLRGGQIMVETMAGVRHELKDLSSGELEMIGLAYFIRRLSASGGILLLDEPEQHLHPTLQAGLFDSMRDIANRAQVIVVSHSVKLIALAPPEGLLEVAGASKTEDNQIAPSHTQGSRIDLIAQLGIMPADLLQSDLLLVVEGESDSTWLRGIFPIELGRAHVMIAGSNSQVLHAHSVLSNMPPSIPWLCVIDRDLRSDDEVSALLGRYSQLHVWPKRTIESLFLDSPLIASALRYNSLSNPPTENDIESLLGNEADPLRNDVLEELVRQGLTTLHPSAPKPQTGSRFEKLVQEYTDYSSTLLARAADVDSVRVSKTAELEATWPTAWKKLVDAKVLLPKVARALGLNKSGEELVDHLAAHARDHADLLPASLVEFRDKITALFE